MAARQLQRLVGQRVLAIHIASVANLDDHDYKRRVVHRVHDAVSPLAESIAVVGAGQLLAPSGAWVGCQALDARHKLHPQGARLDRLELPDG